GDQILEHWKRFHRLNRYRFFQRKLAEPRHTHQFRDAVDLRRTRTALARLAVPSTCKIVGLRCLDLIHGIEYDHSLGYLCRIVSEFAAAVVATPDFENGCAHFISSITCFK